MIKAKYKVMSATNKPSKHTTLASALNALELYWTNRERIELDLARVGRVMIAYGFSVASIDIIHE